MKMDEGKQIPKSVERFFKTLKHLHTEESYKKGLGFKPGKNDIILSADLKSGSTVTQQV